MSAIMSDRGEIAALAFYLIFDARAELLRQRTCPRAAEEVKIRYDARAPAPSLRQVAESVPSRSDHA